MKSQLDSLTHLSVVISFQYPINLMMKIEMNRIQTVNHRRKIAFVGRTFATPHSTCHSNIHIPTF
jgi:hypothetical protein